jgi:aldose 1-epimerase
MQFAFGRRRKLTAALAGLVAAAALLAMGSLALARSSHGQHRSQKSHSKSSGSQNTGKGHHSHPGQGNISSAPWGTLSDGTAVDMFTLTNGSMKVEISNYGGIVQSIWVRDRRGHLVNVALGFPDNQAGLTQYETDFTNPPSGGSGDTYFGAIIGRYANRIANHSFTLNGTTYNLTGNNGPNNINTLHGGPNAYNTQVWHASTATTPDGPALTLTYTDPDGKNGFPGNVDNTVVYTLTRRNALQIDYKATTDAPTVVNFTNHTYFNLAGEGSGDIYGQLLKINADTFTPTDANLIPTGQFASVTGTPFDFRHLKPIGRDIRDASAPQGDQLVLAHGYDHNWVINGSGYRLASVAEDPDNGIVLSTFSDQPGLQVYTGNFLVGDLVGTSGHTYRQGDAFTLETQHYPDSPHHIGDPAWPSVVLNPGDTFTSRTAYQFSTSGRHQSGRHHNSSRRHS